MIIDGTPPEGAAAEQGPVFMNDGTTYLTPERFHVAEAFAVDSIGNISGPAELSFFVDVAPPESGLGASID